MTVLLILQIVIVVALVGFILLQRSTADGLLTSGNSQDSLFSSRGSANFLSRATAILATAFIINSLILAWLSAHTTREGSLLDKAVETTNELSVPADDDGNMPAVPLEVPAEAADDISVPVSE